MTGLVARLALEIRLHGCTCLPRGRATVRLCQEHEEILEALRVALREAAALVRTHDPRRGVPSSESNVNLHFGAHIEEIAAAIEALAEG